MHVGHDYVGLPTYVLKDYIMRKLTAYDTMVCHRALCGTNQCVLQTTKLL